MLFQLILCRMCPLVFLGSLKEQRYMKIGAVTVGSVVVTLFVLAIQELFEGCGIWAILWVVVALFPQWLFYGFASVLVVQCLWKSWSKRVWRRIFLVSIFLILLGILSEFYLNPLILQIFQKIS